MAPYQCNIKAILIVEGIAARSLLARTGKKGGKGEKSDGDGELAQGPHAPRG
jgi:hypothetical protein